MTTFSKRAGTLHTLAVITDELKAAMDAQAIVVQLRGDERYGPVCAEAADVLLPPGLQPGDQLLQVDCDSVLSNVGAGDPAAAAAMAAAAEIKLQMAVGLQPRPRVPIGVFVRPAREVVEVRFYRPPAHTEAEAQELPEADEREPTEPEPLVPGVAEQQPVVALSLSKGGVKCALDEQRDQAAAVEEGRVLWSSGTLLQKQSQLDQLRSAQASGGPNADTEIGALTAALEAQHDLLAVTDAGREISELMGTGEPTWTTILAAFAVAVRIAPTVINQFFRPSRIAAKRKRERRTERLYDKAVFQTLEFIRGELPNRAGSAERETRRCPVLVVGNWATSKKKCNGFAFQRYIDRLARSAIVIVVDEHCTSKLCSSCGSQVRHPDRHDFTKPLYGTVFCPNTSCPTQHRFLNRDVAAASNICNRFLVNFFAGGSLGMFMGLLFVWTDLSFFVLRGSLFYIFFCTGWFDENDRRVKDDGVTPTWDRRFAFATFFSLDAATQRAKAAADAAAADAAAADAAAAAAAAADETGGASADGGAAPSGAASAAAAAAAAASGEAVAASETSETGGSGGRVQVAAGATVSPARAGSESPPPKRRDLRKPDRKRKHADGSSKAPAAAAAAAAAAPAVEEPRVRKYVKGARFIGFFLCLIHWVVFFFLFVR